MPDHHYYPIPNAYPRTFSFSSKLTNEIIEGHIKLTTLSRPPKSLWSVFQTLDLEVFLLALLSSLALWSLQGLPRQTLEQSIKYISLSLYYFPMNNLPNSRISLHVNMLSIMLLVSPIQFQLDKRVVDKTAKCFSSSSSSIIETFLHAVHTYSNFFFEL